jgi:hypothetical protein
LIAELCFRLVRIFFFMILAQVSFLLLECLLLCKVAQMLPASSSFASFVTGGGEHQEFAGASREAGPRLGAKLPSKDDGGGEQVSDPDVQRGQMEYLGSERIQIL